jgi:hypothetical protein
MERSVEFSGTMTQGNVLEECRVRCGKVQDLLSMATDDAGCESKTDDRNQSEAFLQAQEEAQQVQAFLQEVSASLKSTSAEVQESGAEEQAEVGEVADTLDILNQTIGDLALDCESEYDDSKDGFDGDESKE